MSKKVKIVKKDLKHFLRRDILLSRIDFSGKMFSTIYNAACGRPARFLFDFVNLIWDAKIWDL